MRISGIRALHAGLSNVGGACVRGAGNAVEPVRTSAAVLDMDAGVSVCGGLALCRESDTVAHSEDMPAPVAPLLLREASRDVARTRAIIDHAAHLHFRDACMTGWLPSSRGKYSGGELAAGQEGAGPLHPGDAPGAAQIHWRQP